MKVGARKETNVSNGQRKPDRTLEELDGQRWGEPPADATSLVRSVHGLRRRPVASLNAGELARLIRQGVGVRWLLPVALGILEDTAPNQAAGGFYDDDLLSAVLTCGSTTWAAQPELVKRMQEVLASLRDISPYLCDDVERFQRDTRRGR
ncbi:contact-dependent growth inhibition system immunity protein [Streptomyces sp. A1136]|uniref:contact-dependent growth inhibition system immunity protein n=1 Tax=Streptomyces sp. A1136 TaxID=2563102 RepID=UPI00144752A1